MTRDDQHAHWFREDASGCPGYCRSYAGGRFQGRNSVGWLTATSCASRLLSPWRQVWASEGAQATQLRISRMWAGQPQPLPTGDMHVIVATIQTLVAKISRQPGSYEFLADFKLLVFDEAHRSVASTFTSAMQELGLTRWRRSNEPLLIGLTATPYRGHDVAETARLVNRYGDNRLDLGAFTNDDPEEVIRELQAMRILAHGRPQHYRGQPVLHV